MRPVGFVYINLDGRLPVEPAIMIAGFLFNILVCPLLSGLFNAKCARDFRNHVLTAIMAPAIAMVMVMVMVGPGVAAQ